MAALPRRALVATALAAAAPRAATAQGLRPRIAELRLGANLERWFPVAAAQHPRRLGRGWWERFRDAGFDHARLFLPRDAGEGEDVPRLFLAALEDAQAAGVPVLLGLSDFFHGSHPWTEAEWRQLSRRARLFGAETDAGRVVLAPVNEPAFDSPAAWTPVRDRLLAAVRAEAPRHTLMWGGHEWCSWRSLPPQPPPADPNTIAEVHDYEGGDARWVAQRFGAVATWRDRHRVPVVVAELGGQLRHAEDEAAWAADLRRALPELRRLGLPATLWAITHGGHWRLQQADGPAPRTRLAEALRAARQ
jgi:hypothetical protein